MHQEEMQKKANVPKVVPFDTGKVKIGVYYEPPKPQLDYDETLLQNALLGGKWKPSAMAHIEWKTPLICILGFLAYLGVLSVVMK